MADLQVVTGVIAGSAGQEGVGDKVIIPRFDQLDPTLFDEGPALAPAGPSPADVPAPAGRTELPPLLRGYLRLGARVCGEPAHDPEFGVADLYVLLSMRRVDPRYLRHFLSLAPA